MEKCGSAQNISSSFGEPSLAAGFCSLGLQCLGRCYFRGTAPLPVKTSLDNSCSGILLDRFEHGGWLANLGFCGSRGALFSCRSSFKCGGARIRIFRVHHKLLSHSCLLDPCSKLLQAVKDTASELKRRFRR